jgi:RND superfamily putative drug exporter
LRRQTLEDMARVALEAMRIAAGGRSAEVAVATILGDPLGQVLLDHVLSTAADLRAHPELRTRLDAYISDDGRLARIDLVHVDPVFSAAALTEGGSLRRLDALLDDADWLRARGRGHRGQRPVGRHLRAVPGRQAAELGARAAVRLHRPAGDPPRPMVVPEPDCHDAPDLRVRPGGDSLVLVHLLGAGGLDWKVPNFLFSLLVAVGVDYNVFLMARLREDSATLGLRAGIVRAIGQTGRLISPAAAITACSCAAFLTSPLDSLRHLGFALAVGIAVDALLIRPVLVPCGHWLLHHRPRPTLRPSIAGECARRASHPPWSSVGWRE